MPFPFVIWVVVFAEPEPLRLFAWNRTELRLGSYICSIGGKYFLRYFPAGKRIGHYFLKCRKMIVFCLEMLVINMIFLKAIDIPMD